MIAGEIHAAIPAQPDIADLERRLRQSLQATFFSNDRNSSPRRVGQLARELAESFAHYLNGHAPNEAVRDLGERLAHDGIGHQSVLGLIDSLHSIGWDYPRATDAMPPASVRYCNPLLAGYMRGRESALLKEQEQTRTALDRARSHSKPGAEHND